MDENSIMGYGKIFRWIEFQLWAALDNIILGKVHIIIGKIHY